MANMLKDLTAPNHRMNREIISVSREFVVPDGVTKLYVSGAAGGGGGAMGIACGGGGGESCFRRVVNVTPGEHIAVTIGAGGKGCQKGNASGMTSLNSYPAIRAFNGNGSDGTATVFGNHFSLKPGRGATYAGNQTIHAGAAGGAGATPGSPSAVMWPLFNNDVTGMWVGGRGGDSFFGSGGAGGSSWRGQLCCGGNAIGYGGGGGGGGAYGTFGSNVTTKFMEGGSGSNGIIIIEWEV